MLQFQQKFPTSLNPRSSPVIICVIGNVWSYVFLIHFCLIIYSTNGLFQSCEAGDHTPQSRDRNWNCGIWCSVTPWPSSELGSGLVWAEETLPGWAETIIMLFVPGSHRLQRSALRNRGAASQCQSGVTLTNTLSTPTLKVFTKLSKTAGLFNNHIRNFSLPSLPIFQKQWESEADSGEQVTVTQYLFSLLWARGWCTWADGSGRAGRAGGVAGAGRAAESAGARPSGRPSRQPGPARSPRARPHWCRSCQTPSLAWPGRRGCQPEWSTTERKRDRQAQCTQHRMVPGVGVYTALYSVLYTALYTDPVLCG